MKINLNQVLRDRSGNAINHEGADFTLKDACVNALFADDPKIAGKEKYLRGDLAGRILIEKDINLKSEDISKIKELIGKIYAPIIVKQAWDMLEQENK